MGNIINMAQTINALHPLAVVLDENVKQKFIDVYNMLHKFGGEAAYEKQSFFFVSKLRETPELQNTTPFSVFTTFLDLAIHGLSLEPGSQAQCYLQSRKYPYMDGGNKRYELRLVLTISGYGELLMRIRAGQIRYADSPVMVYEEDEFSYGVVNGIPQVSYICHIPHKTNHIVAAFIKITRADGSIDYSVMREEDWHRLMAFSTRQNSYKDKDGRWVEGKPNALYTSNGGGIDSGFLAAKLIKHAFKTYPKVRLGHAELESLQEDEEEIDFDAIYGEAPTQHVEPTPPYAEPQPTPVVESQVKTSITPTSSEDEDDGAF